MSGVRRTADIERILALPRRELQTEDELKALAAELTEVLSIEGRCPGKPDERGLCDACGSPLTLRPVQALALHDIGVHRGAFLPVGVGEGKTLISLLAAYILGAKKPMLFLPASLIENAERARKQLSNHWLVPTNIRMFSYEMLGKVGAEKVLEEYEPDAVLCDEAHKWKNIRAACTRRIARYMAKHSSTPVVAMSGTVMRDSVLDFAHLLWWCLKHGTPLPAERHELEEWASALDEPKPGRPGADFEPIDPGALLAFADPKVTAEEGPLVAARRGFRERLVSTPGVVATAGDGERVDCSIHITAKMYTVAPITEQHFQTLRGDPKNRFDYPGWQRPDGKEFEQGVEVWSCARQLAIGLHYEWSPPPPDDWMKARKAWSAYVRAILQYSRTMDSPEVVVRAIEAGRLEDKGGVLAAWSAIRGKFKPNTVAVWHDETVLNLCAAWGKTPGIIWTEHGHFGRRLSKETGIPYYGAKGLDATGQYIEDGDGKRAIIASIDANRDGKNLQRKWNRNLIVTPPDGWDVWQQSIARTHRPGQTADEVEVDVLFGCREHASAWRKAVAGTYAARDTVGGTPKLLLADLSQIDEVVRRAENSSGWRW